MGGRGGPPASDGPPRVSVPGSVVLRAATTDDLAAIHAIEAATFPDPWSAQAFASLLASTQGLTTVAIHDGAVVGYLVGWRIGDEAEVANLAVRADRRGQGVGAALLRDFLATLDAGAPPTVYLEVRESNAAAQALYRRHGFVAAGRRKGYYARPAEDAVVMRRPGAEVGRGD